MHTVATDQSRPHNTLGHFLVTAGALEVDSLTNPQRTPAVLVPEQTWMMTNSSYCLKASSFVLKRSKKEGVGVWLRSWIERHVGR